MNSQEQTKDKPVAWITPDGEGWRIRFEPPVTETKLGWSPLYEHPPVPSAVEAKYSELLMSVGRKFKGESRHETALKYIRQMEEPSKNAEKLSAARSE